MKRFVKTLAGKIITFVLCIVATCLLVASIGCIVLYVNEGVEVYGITEQEFAEKVVSRELLQEYGSTVLWNELGGRPKKQNVDYTREVLFRILDESQSIVTESGPFVNAGKEYSLVYGVTRNEVGQIASYFPASTAYHMYNNADYYTVKLAVIKGSTLSEREDFFLQFAHAAFSLRYGVFFIALGLLFAVIVFFLTLMKASAKRPDTEELHPGVLYKVPYDLILVVSIAFVAGAFFLGDYIVNEFAYDIGLSVCLGMALLLVVLNVFLGLCMGAAGRIKMKTFLKNTVICKFLNLIWKALCFVWKLLCKLHRFNVSVFRDISIIWKTGLVFCGISIIELLIIVWCDGSQDEIVGMWVVEKIILFPVVMFIAQTLRRLQKSGAMLAEGDLSYQTDTKGMFWDFKEHGENLNSIAKGMAIAVEDRLKSERMKTELITNVSHDIKTPLTSIINYASLIGDESCDNPKITEYSEVLVRQSEKLKRLIEDLVEASKASTGNLEVLLAPCDASVFITQAGGEYEERLQKAELTLITKEPEKELRIMADGRRMWRVFDNLMNNICKYSLPGTRVYLSLEEQGKNAVITFKNTSREPLDMSEEELMERFTRGDSSRNTEGNGLGLSIAKSMAELQGGSLNISIDGDLFKAVLSFPLV